MPYLVTVTNQVNNIGVTESPAYTVQVQDPTTARFTITEALSTVSIRETLSTTSIYLNAIELKLNDLNNFWRDEWIANTADYLHGDLVTYQYSLFLLSTYSEDGTAFYPSSDIPPPDDPNWIRMVWHEAPFQYIIDNGTLEVFGTGTFHSNVAIDGDLSLGNGNVNGNLQVNGYITATNYIRSDSDITAGGSLSAGGSLTVGGSSTLTGNVTAENDLTILGDLAVGGTADGYKFIIHGDSKFDGKITVEQLATFNGPVVINDTATFNGDIQLDDTTINGSATLTGSLEIQQDLTVNDTIYVSHVDADYVKINNQLVINGLNYPISKGLAYQVLMTNGVNTATWANLGEAVIWSLNDDMLTNGFNITTGITNNSGQLSTPALTIGSGVTNNFKNSIKFLDWNGSQTPGIQYTGAFHKFTGIVTATNGIAFGDGTVQTSAITRPLYAGENITFTNSGTGIVISSSGGGGTGSGFTNIIAGTGTNVYSIGSTSTIWIKTATTSTLGGVKVDGVTMVVSADGTISSVNTFTSTSSFVKSIAVNNTGNGYPFISVSTSSGDVSINVINQKTTFGVGLISTLTNIANTLSDRTVTLSTASSTQLGGIKVGPGLDVYGDGTLIGVFAFNTGTVSLSNDMYTNGYALRRDPTTSSLVTQVITTNTFDLIYKDYYYPSSTGLPVSKNELLLDKKGFLFNSNYYSGSYSEFINIGQSRSGIEPNSYSAVTGIHLKSKENKIQLEGNEHIFTSDDKTEISTLYGNINIKSAPTSANGANIDVRAYNPNISNGAGNLNLTADNKVNIKGYNVNINGTNSVSITGTNVTIGDINHDLVLSGYPVKIGPDVQHSTLYVESIYNRAGTYAPFFPAGIQYADSTVQVTAYHNEQPALPPVVNVIVPNWGTSPGQNQITTYADILAALATVGSPTPVYFDGIYDHNNNHTWVYTGYGPLGGWFDENL